MNKVMHLAAKEPDMRPKQNWAKFPGGQKYDVIWSDNMSVLCLKFVSAAPEWSNIMLLQV